MKFNTEGKKKIVQKPMPIPGWNAFISERFYPYKTSAMVEKIHFVKSSLYVLKILNQFVGKNPNSLKRCP
jgi:hypothetical protein